MITSDINDFDLTGEDPNYKRVDRRYKVFKAFQAIDFEEPVYEDSIEVYLYDNGNMTLLQKGTINQSWNTMPDDECLDETAMAKAKMQYIEVDPENTWNHRLVHRIYMQDSVDPVPEYIISVSYQGLERDVVSVRRDGMGPDYTPGLMRAVIERINELYHVRNPIENVNMLALSNLKGMPEDLTGHAVTNYVENEAHYVNTAGNRFVCRPLNGSFYNHDLRVVYRPPNTLVTQDLVQGVDYEVVGVNKIKTSLSEPTSGVYEFILFKSQLEGEVFVSYHAFGGEVSPADLNMLASIVKNIQMAIESEEILTLKNIKSAQVVSDMIYRLEAVEETLRHYQSQTFLYNVTQDTVWANIAYAQRHPWMDNAEVMAEDFGLFRIEIPELGYTTDVRLAYDTNGAEQLKVVTDFIESPSYDKDGIKYYSDRVLVKLRAIWTSELLDGIMLQISITGGTTKQWRVKVSDMTSAKTPWILIDTEGAIRPAEDDPTPNEKVIFPNGAIWMDVAHNASEPVALFINGYTIFNGSIHIKHIDEGSRLHSDPETGILPVEQEGWYKIKPIIVGKDIIPEQVKAMKFYLFDRYTGKNLVGVSPTVETTTNAVYASSVYYMEDMCAVTAHLKLDNDTYWLELEAVTGTNSLDNDRFILTRIDVVG